MDDKLRSVRELICQPAQWLRNIPKKFYGEIDRYTRRSKPRRGTDRRRSQHRSSRNGDENCVIPESPEGCYEAPMRGVADLYRNRRVTLNPLDLLRSVCELEMFIVDVATEGNKVPTCVEIGKHPTGIIKFIILLEAKSLNTLCISAGAAAQDGRNIAVLRFNNEPGKLSTDVYLANDNPHSIPRTLEVIDVGT